MEIKIGDYVLEDNKLYVIMDISTSTIGTFYDLKAIEGNRLYRAVPRNMLRHADKIIPAEKLTKMMRLLYY